LYFKFVEIKLILL